MAGSAAKKTGARANSPKKRATKEVNLLDAVSIAAAQQGDDANTLNAPEEFVPREKLPTPEELEAKANEPKPLYPEGVATFAYQPEAGGKPILLAINGFESPSKLWLFDIAQLPILSQTWAWLDKANVPREIQRRAMELPDDEYFRMYDQWFEAMRLARQAEPSGPKGAVTAGK